MAAKSIKKEGEKSTNPGPELPTEPKGRGRTLPRLGMFKDAIRWNDDEFKEAAVSLNNIPKLMDRLEFMYYHDESIMRLFGIDKREIEGITYEYGIDIKDYTAASSLGWFVMNKELEKWFNERKKDIENRLNRCQNNDEMLSLIDEELIRIKDKATGSNSPLIGAYIYGYQTERRKGNWHFESFHSSDYDVTPSHYFAMYVIDSLDGASNAKIERYLEKARKELTTPQESKGILENIYHLETIPEKLLYLKYTGIYESLKEKHGESKGGKAQLARIIGHILDKKASTIETLLGSLDYYQPKQTKNTVYKREAVEKVIRCLDEINLDTSELQGIYKQLLNQ